MKTRAALVLSVAGILVTGSAALAVNTYALNSAHTSTIGNASSVLLPGAPTTTTQALGATPTPTNTVTSPKATPKVTGKKATPTRTPSPSPAQESVNGGAVTAQPGADGAPIPTQSGVASGGPTVTAPGDDKGGLRGGGSGGHGSDD
jgi:hypothetical protein